MADRDALTLAPARWSDAAACDLARATSAQVSVADYQAMHADGDQLWRVAHHGQPVAHVLTRVEEQPWGREFVIVAAGGGLPGVDLTRDVVPLLDRMAVAFGCATTRTHTARRGVIAKLGRQGYGPVETVLRKEHA